jgi:hypothetical protein
MDTAKSLRERARAWRALANDQHHGTADALIEAACALEVRASHLETDARRAALPPLARGAAITSRRWPE